MEQKKLGFGTMRLPLLDADDPTKIDLEQVCQMMDSFLAQGFTYVDTAYMYHGGASELAVRETLVKRHPRDSFQLADKMPSMRLNAPEDLERIFQDQLQKCGVEYFDYYLMHCLNQENYQKAEKVDGFAFLRKMKEEGKIRHLGFSFHDSAELLEQILQEHPEAEFVQLQLNYVDWDSEAIQSRKCHDLCAKYGKPVVVMEPVKGGTLASVPAEAEALMKHADPNASVASWAVRFAASQPQVFMVLSGMSDMGQIADNTSYMRDFQPLTQEEIELVFQVNDIIYSQTAIPCTACHYCTDGCPMNIPIPEYFGLYNNFKRFGAKSNSAFYYGNYEAPYGKAKDCIACGQCEGACPQHLSVIEHLKTVSEQFDAT